MYLYSFCKQKKLVVFFVFVLVFIARDCTRFQRDKSIAHLCTAVPYSIVEDVLGSVAAHHHVSAASVHNIIGPFANVLVPSDEMRIVFGGAGRKHFAEDNRCSAQCAASVLLVVDHLAHIYAAVIVAVDGFLLLIRLCSRLCSRHCYCCC